MAKTIDYQERKFMVNEWGEVTQAEYKESSHKIEQEPEFVKWYIQDIGVLFKLQPTSMKTLLAMVARSTYAKGKEHGMCVYLSGGAKQEIINEVGIKTIPSLNTVLTKLCKKDLIRRVASGTYIMNPLIFGRGKWKDIKKIRVIWEYNTSAKHRTVLNEFKYETDDNTTAEKAANE